MVYHTKKPVLAIAMGALVLTGCASQNRDSFTVGAVPDNYTTNHPIVISQKEQTLDVAVAAGATKLDIPTASNIGAFARAFADSGVSVIYLLEPAGSANAHAATAVRDDVIEAMKAAGVRREQIAIQSYDASAHGAAAPIRLSYLGVRAETGECGKWTSDLANNSENKHYEDFGCSTQKNLAAIISNPNDLMGPRATSNIDATQRGAVIRDYQEGPRTIASEVSYDW